MTTLDFVNAPLATANFIRIAEGKAPQPGGGRGGPPPGMGGRRPAAEAPEPPPDRPDPRRSRAAWRRCRSCRTSRSRWPSRSCRRRRTRRSSTTPRACIGLSGPNTFYLTLQKKGNLDGKSAAIGKVIAGADHLQGLKKGEPIRSIRITRVGQAARDFKTDDEAFKKLMEGKK